MKRDKSPTEMFIKNYSSELFHTSRIITYMPVIVSLNHHLVEIIGIPVVIDYVRTATLIHIYTAQNREFLQRLRKIRLRFKVKLNLPS